MEHHVGIVFKSNLVDEQSREKALEIINKMIEMTNSMN